MSTIDPSTMVAKMVAQGIYQWYRKGYEPERLSGNWLALFQRFKKSWDNKNIQGISSVISDDYYGSINGLYSKQSLLDFWKSYFSQLPKFI